MDAADALLVFIYTRPIGIDGAQTFFSLLSIYVSRFRGLFLVEEGHFLSRYLSSSWHFTFTAFQLRSFSDWWFLHCSLFLAVRHSRGVVAVYLIRLEGWSYSGGVFFFSFGDGDGEDLSLSGYTLGTFTFVGLRVRSFMYKYEYEFEYGLSPCFCLFVWAQLRRG
jgi:hypothetical protein